MKNLYTFDEHLNEASSAFKHAVQQALQAAGYNLKQSEVKVGAKKVRGMGTKITLNGEMIGFDDEIPKMIASFTKSIEEDPGKYGLKESVNESKFKKGQTVKYIVPGTSDKMKTGKITGFESTRDEDFAVIDGKTISFSHISESVNEDHIDTISEPYMFKVGDIIHDKDLGCKHHGSKGIVITTDPDSVRYTVTNDGNFFKPGDILQKVVDQLELA